MGISELPYGRMKMFTTRVGPTSRSLSTSKCLEAAVSKATHEVSLFCCVARAWAGGQAAASDLQKKSPASCSRSGSGGKSAGNSPGGLVSFAFARFAFLRDFVLTVGHQFGQRFGQRIGQSETVRKIA